ncbi:MAG: Gfo/Idh/MocA family oxidoreductase [Clostridia bacterium]|nr:Gfo/Idh/MocA family oxidoreductase [Clostridia bacterium]
MKKLRIGMVGTGNIASVHLDAYKKIENVEIVAACDINPENLNAAAEKYGIKNTYPSITEMIKNEELDAVDVCVWNCNHAKCSIEALNAGLNVLCEKPMAASAKEAEEMIEAAKKNNKLLMIGFVLRFDDETKIAKDFIDNDYLGDIYYSKAVYLRRHGAPGGWFTDKSRSAGGPVIDLGVHVIDLTRYLMGKPKALSVFASTNDTLKNRPGLKTSVAWKPKDAKPDDIYDVEDFGVAMIKYEGNKTTLLETSYSINGETVTKKELFGTKGGMNLNGKDTKIYTEVNNFIADIVPDTANYNYSCDMFEAEMRHFADCCLNGTKCIAPAEDGLEVMKILDAIYESAKTGHEVIIK